MTYLTRLILIISLLMPIIACGADKSQIFDPLLVTQQAGGVKLAGGKVYFYVPGTTTLKAVYLDRNSTIPAANPYTLSADATAQVYGDGLYDVKITNSAGVQKYFWEDVRIQDIARELVYFDTLEDAVTAIGSNKITLIIAADTNVAANLIIPSNIELQFINGAKVSVSSGITLTINGAVLPTKMQIFTGAGTITGLKEALPEWFGAIGDNVTDDSSALQKAINSTRHLWLSTIYYSSAKLTLPVDSLGYIMDGVNVRSTGIRGSGTDYILTADGTSATEIHTWVGINYIFRNIVFYSTTSTTKGVKFSAIANITMENCKFSGFNGGEQLVLEQVFDSFFSRTYWTNHIPTGSSPTVLIDSGDWDSSNNLRFDNCTWEHNGNYEDVRFTQSTGNYALYSIEFDKCKFESQPTHAKINLQSGILLNLVFEACLFGDNATTKPIFIMSANATGTGLRHLSVNDCRFSYETATTIPYLFGLDNAKWLKFYSNNFDVFAGGFTNVCSTTVNTVYYFEQHNNLNTLPISAFFDKDDTYTPFTDSPFIVSGGAGGTGQIIARRYNAGNTLLGQFLLSIDSAGETQVYSGTTGSILSMRIPVATGLPIFPIGIGFASITAASAGNNTLFRDSADEKLKYKDNTGVVNPLY